MSDDTDRATIETGILVEVMRPILAGRSPEVQSAALADLIAYLLAGMPPPLRPEMRAMFIQLVDDLIPQNERELFGDLGHPFTRSRQ